MIARCELCGTSVALPVLLDHLRVEHGFYEEMERWPDGELVIIDETLQPHEFLERS